MWKMRLSSPHRQRRHFETRRRSCARKPRIPKQQFQVPQLLSRIKVGDPSLIFSQMRSPDLTRRCSDRVAQGLPEQQKSLPVIGHWELPTSGPLSCSERFLRNSEKFRKRSRITHEGSSWACSGDRRPPDASTSTPNSGTKMFRLIKLQAEILFISVFAFFTLPFFPVPLDFEPIAYNVSLPEFKEALAFNNLLDGSKIMFQQKLQGPESLAVKDGIIYTGTRLGDVYAFDPVSETITKVANTGKDCGGFYEEEKCGRVLGLRFAKNGDLYGIDAYKGLLKIDVKTGKVETLVKSGSYVESSRLLFGDDLDIDDDGVIYYSQGSRRWGLHQIIYIVMEYDTSGRILTYDTKTKKSGVLVDGLAFPNGVQLTADRKSLLFSELNAKKIHRYELQGPSKGKLSVFAERLPGGPDNIRLSPRGTYWVGYDISRSAQTPYIADLIAPYPLIAKATMRFCWLSGQGLKFVYKYFEYPTIRDLIADLEHGKILLAFVPKRGIITELDQNGKIIRSLHSSHLTMFSEVLELNNKIYIGSFINPYLLRVDAPKN